jgi:hypothetical protein
MASAQLPRVQIRVSEDLDVQIEQAASAARVTKEKWMIAAVVAALKDQGIRAADTGPLAGLAHSDKKRVERFVKFLRRAPEEIKEASDMGQGVLDKALKMVMKR